MAPCACFKRTAPHSHELTRLPIFRRGLVRLIGVFPDRRIAGFHIVARSGTAGSVARATRLNPELFSSLRIDGSSRL